MSNINTPVSTETLFALTLSECAEFIGAVGHQVTTLVQGHMGCGKSALLKMLAAKYPAHVPVYFDCTTKDVGDVLLPKVLGNDDLHYVRFAPNEELGLHHADRPIILMIDELGKAQPGVKNALLRLMHEREMGAAYRLHPESIVFATTNLGSEGVGDLLPPHARNRISVVRLKKPTVMEWIEDFAYNAGIHPVLIGWCKEMGDRLFQSFEEVINPDDPATGNPYIYHPKSARAAFVTPRSLEKASYIIWAWSEGRLPTPALKAGLIGTLGARAGCDLEAFITLYSELPKQADIIDSPETARLPGTASGQVMVVDRALATMSRELADPWMIYMARLDTEAQGLFVMQARKSSYAHNNTIMTSAQMGKWALANQHLFVQ